MSTTDEEDDKVVAPDPIGNGQEGRKKRFRAPGKIGSKGMPNSHPWDDNESELIIALRASGTSYVRTTKVGFPRWTYIGLRSKYLKLIELPKWKQRLEQIKEMDEFDQLQAICEAQLAVAHSRLHRTEQLQNAESQGDARGPLTVDKPVFFTADSLMADTTSAKAASDEAVNFNIGDDTPLLKPESKPEGVWGSEDVVKDKETMPPASKEEPTAEDKTANKFISKYGNSNKSRAPASSSTLDKVVVEIRETPEPDRANPTRKIEVIVISSDDDV